MSSTTPSQLDLIGPLQLRVMNHLWKVGSGTVQEVMDALNGGPGAKALAYTTFLTVMRNLAKRKLLDQRRTATKRHQFVCAIGEEEYKSAVVKAFFRDYCNNDAETLHRFLGFNEPKHAVA